MTLWTTLITVAVGAFLGSGAAFASNLLAGRISARRREAAALNELVHEIHFRRVLRRVEPRRSPRADVLDPEYERARHSIATLRHEIRRARRASVSRSAALPTLDRMTLACNTFLDRAEDDPSTYQLSLMQLQARLNNDVRSLADPGRGISDLEPGNALLEPTQNDIAVPTEIRDDITW
jgi:hypothetical protein